MEPLSKGEISIIIRSMIEHENELFNHRVGWLIQLQGFLFAALSFAWDKKDTHLLVTVFSVVGMAVSLASLSNMWVYFKTTQTLKDDWDKIKNDCNVPDVVGFRAKQEHNMFLLPMWSLPFIFIIAWLFVLITNLIR
jgi:hypothetical protein